MKRQLLLFIGLFLIVGAAWAQTASKPDVLYKKDKSTLPVFIDEVGDSEIRYRKTADPASPLYSISKATVLKIVYNNGDVEQIRPPKTGTSSKPTPTVVAAKSTVNKPNTTAKAAPVATKKAAVVTTSLSSYVGVKMGGSLFARSVPSGYAAPDFNAGIQAGIFAGFGGRKLTFQPEILFTQLRTTFTVADVTSKTTDQLLAVPLLVKYSVGEGQLRPFVQLGGFGQFLLSSKYAITLAGETTTQSQAFDGQEGRIEYGAVAGVGLTYSLGRVQALLEGRWYHGLGINSSPRPTSGFIRMGTISLGVLLPLGQK